MRDVFEFLLLPVPVLNLETLTWDDLVIFDPGLVQNGVLAQHLTSDPVNIQESINKWLFLGNAGFQWTMQTTCTGNLFWQEKISQCHF